MKDWIINLIIFITLLGIFFVIWNGIVYIACLSSEGTPYFNKVVVACHFDNTMISDTQQIIITSVSHNCSINGKSVDCSNIDDDILKQGREEYKKICEEK